MTRKVIRNWEIFGVFWLIFIGSLLHFTYEWSNQSVIVGIFSAVNESVWEHLKLGFWSLIFFSIIEYLWLKKEVNNFFIAKGIGILALQLVIIITFYSYTFFTKKEILLVDIASYVVGAVVCQIISYKLLVYKKLKSPFRYLGLAILVTHALLLIIFTFNPPKLPLFQDQHTKEYGINQNQDKE